MIGSDIFFKEDILIRRFYKSISDIIYIRKIAEKYVSRFI